MEAKHYTQKNIENIEKLIENENDYKVFVNSIWKIRDGLYAIIENRPKLKEVIAEQFHSINNLISALSPPSNYGYPPYITDANNTSKHKTEMTSLTIY